MILYLAFFLSGMSGLMYQVVWVRMLTRYLGTTTSATATVLCVFMGGLALGAFIGGKIADRIENRLFGYVIIEIGIALTALLSSFTIISVLGGVYVDFYQYFGNNYLFLTTVRIIFSMLCLLIPTVLMGSTLPLLVALISHHNHYFQYGLGRLYSINTFGAVLGVLLTGFFLLGALGERSSLHFAALFNLVAAVFAYQVDKHLKRGGDISPKSYRTNAEISIPQAYPFPIRFWSSITIFVSGFTALAYEILWTRLLMLPLKTSIYAFSFMLGLFLLGIAFGSWLSTKFSISKNRPVSTFAIIEILIGCLTLTGMFIYSFIGRMSMGFTTHYYVGIATSSAMILPVAVAFGWQFPVAVRCCISNSTAPGEETGRAYSANTLGSILGSIAAGFILIPLIGTAATMVMLGLLNIILGAVLFWVSPREERGKLPLAAAFFTVCFCVMAFQVGNPYKTVMLERITKRFGPDAKMFGFYEGVAGTTVPSGIPHRRLVRQLFINGEGMTGLVSETKLMAHLPMALVQDPQRVLVVCFGMGTTVRSAGRFSESSTHIDAVDIVPKDFDSFEFFYKDAERIKRQPNIKLYAEDGRNFLAVRKNLYDVITIDPAPPIHSAGTVNLYTREFLKLCKARIKKQGVVCLWLPPGHASELIMIIKTFVNVFPGASLWGGLTYPGLYLIGGHRSFDQTRESLEQLAERLSTISDLSEWEDHFKDRDTLKRLYLLGSEDLSKIVHKSRELTDDHPYTEFPLWRVLIHKQVQLLTANSIRRHLDRMKQVKMN
jgi:spermidine synthase